MNTSLTKPKDSSSERILGLDLARAFAVVGMVIVNFTVVMNAGEHGPGWLKMSVRSLEGRAAATFVVLAGVGMSLMAKRARDSGLTTDVTRLRKRLFSRALFLFVLGLTFVFIWPADILRFYGLYMSLGAVLIVARDEILWLVALLLPAVFLLLIAVFNYDVGWNFDTLEYAGFWTADGFFRHLFFNGYHPFFPWASFLLVGIWLGRRDLARGRVRARLFVTSVVVALIGHWFSQTVHGWLIGQGDEELAELSHVVGTEMIPPGPFYLWTAGAVAVAVIVACVELSLRFPRRSWLRPLVSTGQLAMTLYVAHVVLGMGLLATLGRLQDQSLPFAVSSALVFSAGSILLATIWRQRFGKGPLEGLMRWLTSEARVV